MHTHLMHSEHKLMYHLVFLGEHNSCSVDTIRKIECVIINKIFQSREILLNNYCQQYIYIYGLMKCMDRLY